MTRIILVRHGQTEWNRVERVRGQVDIALDAHGLTQAAATASRIAEQWAPVAVYCSPLRRARQTAAAIAERLALPVTDAEGMNDMNFGEWQGLSPKEIAERWPDKAQAWQASPETVTFPGGESLDSLRDRAMPALRAIMAHHAGQEVVVVGHTVVNRVVLCAVLGLDNSHHWRIGQDTCAISVFAAVRDSFFIESLNDTYHLRALRAQAGPAL